MKLMTKAIEKKLPALYATDGAAEKEVIAKFFNPGGIGTWYVFEGNKLPDGDYEFFGLVDLHVKELGYFRLSELAEFRGRFGLGIERDRNYRGTYANGGIV